MMSGKSGLRRVRTGRRDDLAPIKRPQLDLQVAKAEVVQILLDEGDELGVDLGSLTTMSVTKSESLMLTPLSLSCRRI